MKATKVINIKDAPLNFLKKDGDQNGYVFIGRPSLFGNPIIKNKICPVCSDIHESNGSTLECYKVYINERMKFDEAFRTEVENLVGKTLVCFCKPKRCHGDILEKITNDLYYACELFF